VTKNAVVFTIIILVMLNFFNTAYSQENITVYLNGKQIKFDVPPVLDKGRTLVPFRQLSEALGVEVAWEKNTGTVYGYRPDVKIALKINSQVAYVNGKATELDMPAVIKQGRTFVPLRFFSETFGATVLWDGVTKTVTISTGLTPKHIMGFYYSSSFKDYSKNYSRLTSIANKWYTIDDHGNLVDNDYSRYIFVPQGYEEVLRIAKQNGIRVYALLFENDPDKLHRVLIDKNNRYRLIKQICEMVEAFQYDGVNIDFERIREKDGEYFSRFIKELAHSLPKNKVLSVSLPAKTEKADWHKAYDYEVLGHYADLVAIMAYDKNPGRPGPQAPINWVEDVIDYTKARIPGNKILLGIGYYGYEWKNNRRKSTVSLSRDGLVYGIKLLDDIIEKYDVTVSWDDTAQTPYIKYTDEYGQKAEIWYENASSLWAKFQLVKQKNLQGIALWRLGYADSDFWRLVEENFQVQKQGM